MPEVISRKTVVARKPHRCMNCGAVAVQPGATYEREVLKYDGRLYSWVSCLDCYAIFTPVWEWADEPEEGIGPHEYLDWARDNAWDPEWGEAARAYLVRRGDEIPEGREADRG